MIINVTEQSDVTDYFVICSANSDRGVKTIAENIEDVLKKEKIQVLGIEGTQKMNWILIDAANVVNSHTLQSVKGVLRSRRSLYRLSEGRTPCKRKRS